MSAAKSSSKPPIQHGDGHDNTPLNHMSRGCTDGSCILVFVAALAGLAACISIGVQRGDLKRLTSLSDFHGRRCGSEGLGSYIYFCPDAMSSINLDLTHQICLKSCPADSNTYVPCYTEGLPIDEGRLSYPSTPIAGMFCMPDGGRYLDQVRKLLGDNKYLDVALKLAETLRNWELLLLAIVLSSIFSFLYLFLVDWCAKILVWLGTFLSISVLGALGGFFIYGSQTGGAVINGTKASTGDAQYDLIAGVACSSVALLILCIVLCSAHKINQSISCIQEACECIFGLPSLLIIPWSTFLAKVLVLVPGLAGFLLILSSMDRKKVNFSDPSTMLTADNGTVTFYLFYYLFIVVWVAVLVNTVAQFVVIYAAEVWFFHIKGAKRSSLCGAFCSWIEVLKGFGAAVTLHLGSLVFGSFLTTIFGPLYSISAFLAHQCEAASKHNAVAGTVFQVSNGCLCCCHWIVKYVSKAAYMDIAMNSHNFCTAAGNAEEVIMSNSLSIGTLEGAVSLFNLTGMGSIAAGTGAVIWLICDAVDRYRDPASPQFVDDPKSLAIASCIFGAIVSLPFLSILDAVADTMFYCEALQHRRKARSAAEAEEDAIKPLCYNFRCWNGTPSETRALLAK